MSDIDKAAILRKPPTGIDSLLNSGATEADAPQWDAVYSARGYGGLIHLKLPARGIYTTVCNRAAGTGAVPTGGSEWCKACDDDADRVLALYNARKAREAGGVMPNRQCLCGCGYPTAQPNGFVRGHTSRGAARRG